MMIPDVNPGSVFTSRTLQGGYFTVASVIQWSVTCFWQAQLSYVLFVVCFCTYLGCCRLGRKCRSQATGWKESSSETDPTVSRDENHRRGWENVFRCILKSCRLMVLFLLWIINRPIHHAIRGLQYVCSKCRNISPDQLLSHYLLQNSCQR